MYLFDKITIWVISNITPIKIKSWKSVKSYCAQPIKSCTFQIIYSRLAGWNPDHY